MTAYLLALIPALGIPFLLYCLWNFSRELRPSTSNAVLLSQSSHGIAVSGIPMSRFRTQPHVFELQHQSRTAS
jgi:hypothetical protein